MIVTLLLCNSCVFYSYLSSKKPSDESLSEISKYLKRKGIDNYDYSFTFKDDCLDSLSKEENAFYLYRIQNGNKARLIQSRFYNIEGEILNGYSLCYGKISAFSEIGDTTILDYHQFPDSFLSYWNLHLKLKSDARFWDIEPSTLDEITQTKSKYFIVGYWNISSGWSSLQMLKKLSGFKKRNKEEVTLILVNTGHDQLMNAE
ncbi:hypothetical protein [Lishizhenia tianjinensis]|nr:hypothetical protein [Lishizhenia tianjinensis]